MTQRILIGFPEDMVRVIDEVCKQEHYERSEFIRAAIREKLWGKLDNNWVESKTTEGVGVKEITSPKKIDNSITRFNDLVEKTELAKATELAGAPKIATKDGFLKNIKNDFKKFSPFSICPKHKGYRNSCGCTD